MSERTHFILLTDIYRSSHLSEAFPAEFAAALSRHNDVVERAIADAGGRVLKGLGDGYIALFNDAPGAAAAAVAVQGSFGDETFPDGTPLRLRVVAHGGALREVSTDSGTDFYGPALNRAARIAQVCHPGQLLISDTVRTFLPDGENVSLPKTDTPVRIISLGDHRLRDLAEPEALYQLLAPIFAVQEFPPLASLEGRPNNLVQMPGSFIGREAELEELRGLLLGSDGLRSRLLTIVAPGGYGKSRLAAQLLSNMLEDFGSGVFEVRLASLSDAGRIPEAIAAATGFQFFGNREPRQQILDYLREKDMLLHFDNFEHLLEGAALITEILQTAPRVQIVITSREPLRLRDEKVYRLEPLPTDTGGDAVRLFVERASMVRHDFALDARTEPVVQRITNALGGVPLAIELAAAWVDSFSLDELAAEMDHQLELTARMADVPERHRSVRASCDWSWAQLTDQQKSLLRRCSVFKGGFFIEAAEAVLGLTGLGLRKALAELCDKSWLYTRELRWEEDGRPTTKTRYQLRDAAAREYAWEKLVETKYEVTA
jgi:predicted ATPase/class 3 adenylate cyclase